MERQPAFPLENLTDQDLEFLVRLGRSQAEIQNFWRPFAASAAMALAERSLYDRTVVSFAFPENLSVQDAGLLHNELAVLLFKAERGSEGLKTLIMALEIVAGRAAEQRALMN